MPDQPVPLDRSRCMAYVRAQHLLPPPSPPGAISATVEWFVKDGQRLDPEGLPAAGQDLRDRVSRLLAEIRESDGDAGPLFDSRGQGFVRLGQGAIGQASGGQVRYQTPTTTEPGSLSAELRLHVGGFVHRLSQAGIRSVFLGMDPYHDADQVPIRLTSLRQRLMESYLEQTTGDHGPQMMRCASSLMIKVHPGEGQEVGTRLEAAARLAPLMAAIFANSPLRRGRATEWVSRRLHHLIEMEARRTSPVPWSKDGDPAQAITDFALSAPVMLKDDGFGGVAALGDSPTFEAWIDGPHPQGKPTLLDWRTHLSTLFPPVWLHKSIEIRALDAQAPQWLPVPVAMWWALLWGSAPEKWTVPGALPEVDYETVAARGIREPEVADAAHRIFDHAVDVLQTAGSPTAPASLLHLVRLFRRSYLDRGRMPADDLLVRNTDSEIPHRELMGDNAPT